MYQFEFILENDDDKEIIVLGDTYSAALKKLKAIKIPDFNTDSWILHRVIEIDEFRIGLDHEEVS